MKGLGVEVPSLDRRARDVVSPSDIPPEDYDRLGQVDGDEVDVSIYYDNNHHPLDL